MRLGNCDIAKIDVRGETIAALKRKYRLHSNIDLHLQWMGPMGPDTSFGGGQKRTGR